MEYNLSTLQRFIPDRHKDSRTALNYTENLLRRIHVIPEEIKAIAPPLRSKRN